MTKRTTIPFSASNARRLSPARGNVIRCCHKGNGHERGASNRPCGIHVARTESLRFLLLNAVLTPTTMKYFLLLVESLLFSDVGAPLSIDSCAAFAAANSISNVEMVLSSVLLLHTRKIIRNSRKRCLNQSVGNSLYSMLRVGNFLEDFLWHPFHTILFMNECTKTRK